MKLSIALVASASLFASAMGQGTLTIDFENVPVGEIDETGFTVGPVTVRKDTSFGCTRPLFIEQELSGNKLITNDGLGNCATVTFEITDPVPGCTVKFTTLDLGSFGIQTPPYVQGKNGVTPAFGGVVNGGGLDSLNTIPDPFAGAAMTTLSFHLGSGQPFDLHKEAIDNLVFDYTDSCIIPTAPGPAPVPAPGPSGGGNGDPHFKKWSGEWYDFHGICDQVLVKSPSFDNGLGLDIHVRTKPRYQYSFIEATSIKIGDDVFQVGSWGQYWLNGVEGVELPTTLANKYVVDRVLENKKHNNFVIALDATKKESIVINSFKDMVNVNVENASVVNFGTSSGLLGSFPDGVMLGRDGATIIEDNNLFGQEWQVLANADPDLFLSANPNQQLAGVCVSPVISEQGRRLGEEGITIEAAEKACAHHKNQEMMDMCIMDVLAMADLEVAEVSGAY